jgi:hypothetical protein
MSAKFWTVWLESSMILKIWLLRENISLGGYVLKLLFWNIDRISKRFLVTLAGRGSQIKNQRMWGRVFFKGEKFSNSGGRSFSVYIFVSILAGNGLQCGQIGRHFAIWATVFGVGRIFQKKSPKIHQNKLQILANCCL